MMEFTSIKEFQIILLSSLSQFSFAFSNMTAKESQGLQLAREGFFSHRTFAKLDPVMCRRKKISLQEECDQKYRGILVA
jgi:hypothetical protein